MSWASRVTRGPDSNADDARTGSVEGSREVFVFRPPGGSVAPSPYIDQDLRRSATVSSESQSPRREPGLRLIASRSSERFTSLRACGLNRRAQDRTVRTEDATVAWLRTKHRPALDALVEELAGVHGHRFCLRCSAGRTGDRGFRDHGGPSPFFASGAPRRGACGTAHVGTPKRGRSHL